MILSREWVFLAFLMVGWVLAAPLESSFYSARMLAAPSGSLLVAVNK